MDPEEKRVQELALLVRSGQANDAERTELALYVEEDPKHQALATRALEDEQLGGKWLARAEKDQALVRAESTALTKAERNVGVALMVGGGLGSFVFPMAFLATISGAALLVWSVLRVQIKTFGKDPYKDIEQ